MNKTMKKLRALVDFKPRPPAPLCYMDIFPPKRRLNILLVEDDEPDAYLIGKALSGNPRVLKVMVAEDGVKALELIDRGWIAPDLAIIDLHMPRKDGFSLLRALAGRETGQFPKVILTSSSAGPDAHRAMHCGAVEFITKSNTLGTLAASLDRAIYNAA